MSMKSILFFRRGVIRLILRRCPLSAPLIDDNSTLEYRNALLSKITSHLCYNLYEGHLIYCFISQRINQFFRLLYVNGIAFNSH